MVIIEDLKNCILAKPKESAPADEQLKWFKTFESNMSRIDNLKNNLPSKYELLIIYKMVNSLITLSQVDINTFTEAMSVYKTSIEELRILSNKVEKLLDIHNTEEFLKSC